MTDPYAERLEEIGLVVREWRDEGRDLARRVEALSAEHAALVERHRALARDVAALPARGLVWELRATLIALVAALGLAAGVVLSRGQP